ncbi:unnamed protein product [Arctogadus glacialis]
MDRRTEGSCRSDGAYKGSPVAVRLSTWSWGGPAQYMVLLRSGSVQGPIAVQLNMVLQRSSGVHGPIKMVLHSGPVLLRSGIYVVESRPAAGDVGWSGVATRQSL